MTRVVIPISDRARKYGYLYWEAPFDQQVNDLLDGATSVDLVFQKAEHGKKNVDWKNRRISIGWRWTRALPSNLTDFVLTFEDKDKLNVVCR